MSLSIDCSDRSVLSRCQLGSQLIAIDSSQPGHSRLALVNRCDVSCWDVFISMFGFGTLASKTISLTRVANYLNQYSWTGCQTSDRAYLNVCALANRAMLRGSSSLYHRISSQLSKSIELVQFIRGGTLTTHQVNQGILWNAALQVKHLRAQLNRDYVRGCVQIREGGVSLDANSYLSEQRLRNAQIVVRQDMTPEIREVPVPVRATQRSPRYRSAQFQ